MPFTNIDEYIESFPDEIGSSLREVRAAIRRAAPMAEEKISYQMPAFAFNGILVYFAGFKNHIGFYPTASGIKAFKDELKPYKSGKGSVQFPHSEPLPLKMVARIAAFRAAENEKKAAGKGKSNRRQPKLR